MSRHPIARDWKRITAFLALCTVFLVAALMAGSSLLVTAALLVTVVAAGVYLLGEGSDLPGTSGDDNKNVPT